MSSGSLLEMGPYGRDHHLCCDQSNARKLAWLISKIFHRLCLTHVLQTTVKQAPVVAMDSSQILLLLPLLAI
ncbi:hypothetical protein P8452_06216 [Trifolium repens]|nr:hypothetical protein P8452_06216 [Trifolium repens]